MWREDDVMAKSSQGKPSQGFWLWIDKPPPDFSKIHFLWFGDTMLVMWQCKGCGRPFAMATTKTGRPREYCTHVCAATAGRYETREDEARVRIMANQVAQAQREG